MSAKIKNTKSDFPKMLFGESYDPQLLQMFRSDLSSYNASKFLDAIVHAELKDVVDTLRWQAEKECDPIAYSTTYRHERMRKYNWGMVDMRRWGEPYDFNECLLFTDTYFWNGFNSMFSRIIESSLPKYRLAKSYPFGDIMLIKRYVYPNDY